MSAKFWRTLASLIVAPVILSEFFEGSTGAEYEIGFTQKLVLVLRFVWNYFRVRTASHVFEHVAMATRIMRTPKSLPGCIIECGCWKGGSAANLSLVAKLCGRTLNVFDSFAGLPSVPANEIHTYTAGEYCGALPEVQGNILRCGALDCCRLHEGFFDATLPAFHEPAILIFVDVDLTISLKSCLKYLWPQLSEGCYFFTHEARDREIIEVFFDRDWWRQTFRTEPPGLIGAGTGLGLIPFPGGFISSLAYTVKESSRLSGSRASSQQALTEPSLPVSGCA
jgi:hypothetical protein